ncbi:MAG: SMC-Scp complex subunit ScpB, partial [Thermoguttaceae bacterium]|nr:SMC-Scp complex subunit ScpB [Thermoguttaceae bacterium]
MKNAMAELTDTARLEAALFLAREPVSGRRLANLAGIADPSKIRPLLRELNRRYLADNSAFGVVEVADGYQLRTRPEFAPWLFRLQEVPIEVRLSPAAMETLSIIAYRQPILRA